jgi:hypothetical protein
MSDETPDPPNDNVSYKLRDRLGPSEPKVQRKKRRTAAEMKQADVDETREWAEELTRNLSRVTVGFLSVASESPAHLEAFRVGVRAVKLADPLARRLLTIVLKEVERAAREQGEKI